MKVGYPVRGYRFMSQDVLPASCTSKPQVTYTSTPRTKVNEGYSNQEIYEGIVSIKNQIKSFFSGREKKTSPINYMA